MKFVTLRGLKIRVFYHRFYFFGYIGFLGLKNKNKRVKGRSYWNDCLLNIFGPISGIKLANDILLFTG